jgi:hypothetical protein
MAARTTPRRSNDLKLDMADGTTCSIAAPHDTVFYTHAWFMHLIKLIYFSILGLSIEILVSNSVTPEDPIFFIQTFVLWIAIYFPSIALFFSLCCFLCQFHLKEIPSDIDSSRLQWSITPIKKWGLSHRSGLLWTFFLLLLGVSEILIQNSHISMVGLRAAFVLAALVIVGVP